MAATTAKAESARRVLQAARAARGALGAWGTPVSYTHLDVYKRQAQGRAKGREGAMKETTVNVDEKLAVDKFNVDEGNPHIVLVGNPDPRCV